MGVSVARRDRSPQLTYRRVRSAIVHLGGTRPIDTLRWIAHSIASGRSSDWWDINVIIDRATVALQTIGYPDCDVVLERALDDVLGICNFHLQIQ